MISTISFRCSRCRARIKAPVQILMQSRLCPGCGHRFVVQPQVPPEAGPKLVPDESWPGLRNLEN
jgi:DNA-directed RNA polymerase subunit RPC12/RpoP